MKLVDLIEQAMMTEGMLAEAFLKSAKTAHQSAELNSVLALLAALSKRHEEEWKEIVTVLRQKGVL